ncbi:MAG: NUDIX domain-containing protein [Humibacillus sp.]|nr:NUDIX domain-containing protein [Humibacillus sp.]MDN5779999.1 NUDIX domain-containing protein [Humibacillus sp.]
MPIPPFVALLRRKIGHDLLWMPGITAVVLRDRQGQPGHTSTAADAADPGHSLEVLLIKRSDTGAWTPVTGITDPGEQSHLTAEREVLEEASVVARVERLVWVCSKPPMVHENGDRAQYLDHTFRCRWVSGEPTPGDDEASEAAWFSLDALPEMSAWSAERIECAVANAPEVRLGD